MVFSRIGCCGIHERQQVARMLLELASLEEVENLYER